MSETLASLDAINKVLVDKETWGHLYPESGKTYKGSILYTHTEYGDIDVIRARWESHPLRSYE